MISRLAINQTQLTNHIHLGALIMTAPIVKAFSATLISKGVQAIGTGMTAAASKLEFFKGLKTHKVDAGNIKDFRAEFDRVAIAYLDTVFSDEKNIKIVSTWLKGAEKMRGDAESPIKDKKGKALTKRDLEQWRNSIRKNWVDQYEQALRGKLKETGTRTKRSIFESDVKAMYPRLAAYQKIESPTQREIDQMKLVRACIEHAVAGCPNAKSEYASLMRKAEKAIK
jgi:hypothetical protein